MDDNRTTSTTTKPGPGSAGALHLLRLLSAWGLVGPAWIFIETFRPLAFLGEQAFLLLQPLLPDAEEIPFFSEWVGILTHPAPSPQPSPKRSDAGIGGNMEQELSEESSWI